MFKFIGNIYNFNLICDFVGLHAQVGVKGRMLEVQMEHHVLGGVGIEEVGWGEPFRPEF